MKDSFKQQLTMDLPTTPEQAELLHQRWIVILHQQHLDFAEKFFSLHRLRVRQCRLQRPFVGIPPSTNRLFELACQLVRDAEKMPLPTPQLLEQLARAAAQSTPQPAPEAPPAA